MVFKAGIQLRLESVACCMCGGQEGDVCLEGRDVEFETCDNSFQFIQCAACGHVYLNPRPRPDEMDIIYRDYLTTNPASAYYPSPLVAAIKGRLFDRPRLRPILRRLRRGGNVLDVGAGAGRLLLLIRAIADGPVALFANDIAFSSAVRERFAQEGVHTLEGPIEACVTDARFDVITAVHVIEHVGDPRAVFRWAYDHLNPHGAFYLETPDAETVLRRIFGNHWGHTHFPRHFNLFSKRHLAALATDAGLRVARHVNTTSAPVWNMSIRNRLQRNAREKRRGLAELFNYSNVGTLGLFTLVDLLMLGLGLTTSTQKLVAVKPGP